MGMKQSDVNVNLISQRVGPIAAAAARALSLSRLLPEPGWMTSKQQDVLLAPTPLSLPLARNHMFLK